MYFLVCVFVYYLTPMPGSGEGVILICGTVAYTSGISSCKNSGIDPQCMHVRCHSSDSCLCVHICPFVAQWH